MSDFESDIQDFVENGGSDAYTFRFVHGAKYADKTDDEVEAAMIRAEEIVINKKELLEWHTKNFIIKNLT